MTTNSLHVDDGQTINEQISERVMMAMFRAKMKHKRIAESVGLAPASWHHRMQGDRPWRAEEVLRVAVALNVPVTDLLPRLDLNQQPAVYARPLVTAFSGRHLSLVENVPA